MTQTEYQQLASGIPDGPGIYKYYDQAHTLLYVGKAKNLRKRTASYFSKTYVNYKTAELVRRIARIEFTLVNSEQDAFLLENSLIKQFQPMFNIDLKDDKSYPFIVVKKEDFPRVFLTRRKIKDGSEYLGPFTSTGKVRDLLGFIRQFIPLRTCKLPLTPANIARGKFKVCLEYHLGNCKGPCEGFQSLEDYGQSIHQVRQLLKGNLAPVVQEYQAQMKALAAELKFEKAAQLKKKLEHLELYQAKSVILPQLQAAVDVFTIIKDGPIAYVNFLMLENGAIVQTHTTEAKASLDETEAEVLQFAAAQMRNTFSSEAKEVIVPMPIELPGVTITVPKAGEKLKLLELSQKNANYYQLEIRKRKMLQLEDSTEKRRHGVLEEIQQALKLPALPAHIECFDNSNLQGSYPVSAMVCFKNGIPSKDEYRRYNVKTVVGINDFATMKEVVYRRYKRVLQEGKPLPQLVIIDGGKGQLSAAMEAANSLEIGNRTAFVGLAKNEEELFFPGDSQSLKMDWHSEGLKLIRRIRDEVHRFGITFHRQKRSEGTFKNELEDIKGIGKATAAELLKKFKSVRKVKDQSFETLEEVIGPARARIIQSYFYQKDNVVEE